MILSDEGIKRALASGEIEIDPAPAPDHYAPSAVDITLGDISTFFVWDLDRFKTPGVSVTLNLHEQRFGQTLKQYSRPVVPEKDGSVILRPYHIEPNVMLCQTLQRIFLKPESKLAARVDGRSSGARSGLLVHLTAPTIHAGFSGTITLEMVNLGPFDLKLVPKQSRICQYVFERLETPPVIEMKSTFQHQTTPHGKT